MVTGTCDPVAIPYSDVVDKWVARCPCGWEVEFADQAAAQSAANQHRQEATP